MVRGPAGRVNWPAAALPLKKAILTMPIGSNEQVYTVSELNRLARQLLEQDLPRMWVSGEISNLARPASGHLYFSLKD